MKTAALSELTSTTNNIVRPEELIGDMPLSPSSYGMNNNLTVDGHNEVDTISRGCYHLLALSAHFRRSMILDDF